MIYLAENIKRLRHEKGWDRDELAKRAKTTSIAMIEAGHVKSPQADTLERIAKVLNVTVADLFAEPAK